MRYFDFPVKVRDNQRVRVNIVLAPQKSLANYKAAIPFQTLRQFGFKQMLMNVVEAPEAALCFFCQYHGLHHIPIAPNLRPEEIERINRDLPDLQSFFTADMRVSDMRPPF